MIAGRIVGSIITILALGGASVAQTNWDLPSGLPPGNPHVQNLQMFVDDVHEAVGDRLNITIHPSASLFRGNEIKRAVQTGQTAIGELPMGILENENPIFAVDSVPFLTASFEDAYKLWQAQRPFVEKALEDDGLLLLYALTWPPQGIYSRDEITSTTDLEGKRWRAYDPLTERIGEEVGARPVSVLVSELAQALSVGMVDTMLTSAATGVDIDAWESVNYFYEMNTHFPKMMVIVNQAEFENLEPEVQEALISAAESAEQRGWEIMEANHERSVEVLKENGMQVVEASPEFQSQMEEIGERLLEDWLERAGDGGKAIIDAYRN